MENENDNEQKVEAPSLIYRLLTMLKNRFQQIQDWFSPPQYTGLDNEAGKLLERHNLPASWLDTICSNWCHLSGQEKALYLTAASLATGMLGLVAFNAPVFFSLTAAFFGLIGHGLAKSHEKHRFVRAQMLATESQQLCQHLDEQREEMATRLDEMNTYASVFGELSQKKALLDKREEEQDTSLNQAETHVKDTMRTLDSETKKLTEATESVTRRVFSLSAAIDKAQKTVSARSTKIAEWEARSESEIKGALEASKKLNQLVSDLSEKRGEMEVQEGEVTETFDELDKELDENDAFIHQLQEAHPTLCSV